jgi:site-specific DNA recombinase
MKSNGDRLRAVLYARVSTSAGQDPQMQLRELRDYCERRGLQIVDEYVDRGVSGSKERGLVTVGITSTIRTDRRSP